MAHLLYGTDSLLYTYDTVWSLVTLTEQIVLYYTKPISMMYQYEVIFLQHTWSLCVLTSHGLSERNESSSRLELFSKIAFLKRKNKIR